MPVPADFHGREHQRERGRRHDVLHANRIRDGRAGGRLPRRQVTALGPGHRLARPVRERGYGESVQRPAAEVLVDSGDRGVRGAEDVTQVGTHRRRIEEAVQAGWNGRASENPVRRPPEHPAPDGGQASFEDILGLQRCPHVDQSRDTLREITTTGGQPHRVHGPCRDAGDDRNIELGVPTRDRTHHAGLVGCPSTTAAHHEGESARSARPCRRRNTRVEWEIAHRTIVVRGQVVDDRSSLRARCYTTRRVAIRRVAIRRLLGRRRFFGEG